MATALGDTGLNPDMVNTFFNDLALVSSSSNQAASDLALLEEAERRCTRYP